MHPSRLIIEVTERSRWNDDKQINCNIEKLTAAGIKIAVDDFITGYANFSVLLNDHVSIIKIDKSITKEVITDKKARIFFEQFWGLAKHLNKTVVVEGIEECEQALLLHSEGYNLFQGYYFASPTDIDGICRYLRSIKAAQSRGISSWGRLPEV